MVGLALSIVGIGSFATYPNFVSPLCCVFVIVGPILAILGFIRAGQASDRSMNYPPGYPVPPYAVRPMSRPVSLIASPIVESLKKECRVCAANNPGDATFCMSCGTTM